MSLQATPYTYNTNTAPSVNAQNMVNNQNANYNNYMANLPQYQANIQNQAIDQGNQNYNAQKQQIDTSANKRGLLYSGLKTGAESAAANNAANQTQNNIAQGNQNLQNYTQNYGNQVLQSNYGNYMANTAMNQQSFGNAQQQSTQNQGFLGQMMGGGLSSIVSDEDAKDDVKDDDKETNKMVGLLKAKSFSYKDDPDKKKQLGILAQDLEKSPMGKAIIIQTPKGKALDAGKALSAVLAVQSVLDKRLRKLSA